MFDYYYQYVLDLYNELQLSGIKAIQIIFILTLDGTTLGTKNPNCNELSLFV